MKQQTWIIFTLLFALMIAIFAVINVDSVQVDFLFVRTEAPLILVILLSALLGCLAVASVTYAKFYQLKREIKQLKKENELLQQHEEVSMDEHKSINDEGDREINLQNDENLDSDQKSE
uniref:LapA family protein n=1 Tax=uncultured Allobacillus sp. TaxID=1638025 RepID=UPI0025920188|nr:lipopolysaccharide assembly protein LapA domain-containing protein [uncultured Allobacillus sp.]